MSPKNAVLTIRLNDDIESVLQELCTFHRITKTEAVYRGLQFYRELGLGCCLECKAAFESQDEVEPVEIGYGSLRQRGLVHKECAERMRERDIH